MINRLVSAIAFVLCTLTSGTASAAVVGTLTTTPLAIDAGESITASLSLYPLSDPGYFSAQILSGTVTFNSGDGQTAVQNVASGAATQYFSQTFTYENAGSYLLSYVVSVLVQQAQSVYQYLYSYQGIVGYGSYSCGIFGSSTCSYPIYGPIPVYGYQTYYSTRTQGTSGGAYASVTAAVPLPAGIALLGGALAALGLFSIRRRNTAARFQIA